MGFCGSSESLLSAGPSGSVACDGDSTAAPGGVPASPLGGVAAGRSPRISCTAVGAAEGSPSPPPPPSLTPTVPTANAPTAAAKTPPRPDPPGAPLGAPVDAVTAFPASAAFDERGRTTGLAAMVNTVPLSPLTDGLLSRSKTTVMVWFNVLTEDGMGRKTPAAWSK